MTKLNRITLSGTVTFRSTARPACGDVWIECRSKEGLGGKRQWNVHLHVFDGVSWCWLRPYGEIFDLVFETKERFLKRQNAIRLQVQQRRGLVIVRYCQRPKFGGPSIYGFAFERQIPHLPFNCFPIGSNDQLQDEIA
jgi:hypothetical protein